MASLIARIGASSLLLGVLITSIKAAPAAAPVLLKESKHAAITALSPTQIDVFTPFAWYASAAYCELDVTSTWECGADCESNPSFKPVAVGGDGGDDPFWYVGYDPTLDTVIVAHEGTNSSSIAAYLEDADFFLESLSPTLFPGIDSSIEAHTGFQSTHAAAAPFVLAAVQTTLAQYATNSVTITGHSLGAAIAVLDAIYLPLNLPQASSLTFTTYGFGLPRVGNQDFANYIDEHATLTHINNEEDFVPILPGMFLGFVHPSGEVHIKDSGEWAACPGQDNPSTSCIVGDVPYIWDGDLSNHDGPYNGVEMGCKSASS